MVKHCCPWWWTVWPPLVNHLNSIRGQLQSEWVYHCISLLSRSEPPPQMEGMVCNGWCCWQRHCLKVCNNVESTVSQSDLFRINLLSVNISRIDWCRYTKRKVRVQVTICIIRNHLRSVRTTNRISFSTGLLLWVHQHKKPPDPPKGHCVLDSCTWIWWAAQLNSTLNHFSIKVITPKHNTAYH